MKKKKKSSELDWLCYLAGNFQTAPTIFFHIFRIFILNDFIKNPQTRNARSFLPLTISAVGSVYGFVWAQYTWYMPKPSTAVLPYKDKPGSNRMYQKH